MNSIFIRRVMFSVVARVRPEKFLRISVTEPELLGAVLYFPNFELFDPLMVKLVKLTTKTFLAESRSRRWRYSKSQELPLRTLLLSGSTTDYTENFHV